VKGGAIFILSGGSSQFTGPPSTQIEDRNHLALAILMVIPLMNYLRVQSAQVWIRVGLLAAMLLSVLAVIGTYSRGGFIGLVVLGGMIWLRSRHKLASLVLVGSSVALVMQVAPPAWLDRMSTIQTADQADDSFKSRLVAWQTYLAAAQDRPLTGAGLYALNSAPVFFQYQPYETIAAFENTRPRAAHSIYFQVLGELGVIAFLVYFIALAVALTSVMLNAPSLHTIPNDMVLQDLHSAILLSISIFLIVGAALSAAFYDPILIILVAASASRHLWLTNKYRHPYCSTLIGHPDRSQHMIRPATVGLMQARDQLP
jgi:probable O-glycosylation ligase (exosortase A-associated)